MTKRRKIAGAVAGVAVLAAVVGGAAWAARGGSAPAAVPAAAEPSAAAPVVSACGLAGTVDPGASGAQAAHWEDTGGGWMLPVSDTDGPGLRDPHGAWSCFADTPSGAVLAAVVISGRVELADDWRAAVRAGTMPGPGQDALLSHDPTPLQEMATIRGFTVAAYSAQRATVGLYMHTASLEALCTVNLEWSGNDWRIQLQEDGGTSTGCRPGVPEVFTAWGPA